MSFEPGSPAARAAERARLSGRLATPEQTVTVAVLDAGAGGEAADRLADQLRDRRVPVGAVGTLPAARSGGLEILYAPGHERHADMLARLLVARNPAVAPLDSTTAAAGDGAQLAVVIG